MPRTSPLSPADTDYGCDNCGSTMIEDWYVETETVSIGGREREVVVAWVGRCVSCESTVVVR